MLDLGDPADFLAKAIEPPEAEAVSMAIDILKEVEFHVTVMGNGHM